ncbi:DUF131 domain-containing protein [Candidatus Bathyarchaeota archaeon]|nr:DUF131 domain-containing protein [Candidatus Bathyarchaeota archaeon]
MSVKICELCGKRNARYICQECGKAVCERCIEPYTWLCLECYGKTEVSARLGAETEGREVLQSSFIKLFIIGFMLMFIGMIILFLAALLTGLKDSLSFIFLIGPIPIILGSGQYSLLLIILATVLTIICLAAFIFVSRRRIG